MQHHYIPVCVPEGVFLTTAAFISSQNIGEPCDEFVSIVKSVTLKDTHIHLLIPEAEAHMTRCT